MPIKTALFGAAGRMGRAILSEAKTANNIEIARAYEKPGHDFIGEAIEGVRIEETPREISRDIQVIIDFSTADRALSAVSKSTGIPLVEI